jgi:hypothetical protein
METNEITHIKKWLRIYSNPSSVSDFNKSFKELKKVHDKYGTIDINIIKSLIQ